jgi:gamma-glutamyl phosphate reductase
MMSSLIAIGKAAKKAESLLRIMNTDLKDQILEDVAKRLVTKEQEILSANAKDVENAKKNGMNAGLIDRLLLTDERIASMADGLRQVVQLEDPIGEVLAMKKRPNNLLIGQKRVPLGVIGMIYEARPNVTVDAFGLCFKTGNVAILKGGSDALHSNKALVLCIQEVLREHQVDENAVQLIEDTNRETAIAFMKLKEYIDVLIPRGGAGLIQTVVENSMIPVIETGTGNCHIYVDETADFQMAIDIIFNAKTQRIGVCNACESLVVHKSIITEFLPLVKMKLDEKQVELRGDEAALAVLPMIKKAEAKDFATEYLDYIMSIKTVSSIAEAISHINQYSTHHSEAIITRDYENGQRFLNEIDSAAVYINASTRFTDGFEFGFGAEIGISTQKIHVRGPMGLAALTTSKYIIYGNGQVR